jgi:hypothetical protein
MTDGNRDVLGQKQIAAASYVIVRTCPAHMSRPVPARNDGVNTVRADRRDT